MLNASPSYSHRISMPYDQPLDLPVVAAALPYRRQGDCYQILLVRSTSGRWIIPKGRCEPGESTFEAASREAWEEAGVRGEIAELPYAVFEHNAGGNGQQVLVHPLSVRECCANWPEQHSRPQMWISANELPADMNPDLARIITDFVDEFCPVI